MYTAVPKEIVAIIQGMIILFLAVKFIGDKTSVFSRFKRRKGGCIMELLNSILYDTVYHSAPIILCVIGGIFAYKANVLNIALEGMMLNGAFISVLVSI